jgi:hypothetical protein
MNKIKYDQLIREFIEVLNPKKNVRYFWKWLTKDVSYIRFKPRTCNIDISAFKRLKNSEIIFY